VKLALPAMEAIVIGKKAELFILPETGTFHFALTIA